MTGFRAFIAWALIIGLAVTAGMLVFDREEAPEKPLEQAPLEEARNLERMERVARIDGADIVAEDIELAQGQSGRIDWKIAAKSARYDQEEKVVSIEMPQLVAYVGDDRDEVFVRAMNGEVDQESDNFRLWESVDGRYGMFAVSADEFDYIGAMDKVYLKGEVIIYRPDISVTAKAIEIDVKTKELLAAGGVKAILTPSALTGKALEEFDAAQGQ